MAEDSVQNSKEELSESWSFTQIQVVKLRHTWTISNFSFCDKINGERLESPTFSAGTNSNKLDWSLSLYPEGNKKETTDSISLYLNLVTCSKGQIQTKYKLNIVNAKGQNVISLEASKRLKEGENWGFEEFVKKNFLNDKENNVLLNDTLTIVCNITATVGSENILGTFTAPQNHLEKDFAFLLENEDFSDVTLSAGGKEFPAHKAILSAGSSVFKAMFQHNMKENISNQVEITDMDEKTLEEMLRFIYSGKIHRLDQMASSLLEVAEKYAMEDLKITCAKTLFESLSLDNAAEIFILSDTFRAKELKDQVKDFIVAYASDIAKTPGYKSMIQTHSHLGIELLCVLMNID